MFNYILRRLLYGVLVLVGVNLLTFVLFFAVNTPDDMARMNIGGKRVSADAIARSVRIAVGGVADFPIAQDWPTLQETDLDDALNEFAWSLEARDDLHLSAAQRRHLVRNLGRQALDQALAQSSMKWERT
jgi:hypothetical protein